MISIENIDLLLRGASILACGGGVPYKDQHQQLLTPLLQSALQSGVMLLEPEELEPEDRFITVAEIGAADAPVMDKSKLKKALQVLQQNTGHPITGLIPGEIGQEATTLEAAAVLKLPVVNSDLAGCRAVPRLTDLSLVAQGVGFTMSPLVVLQKSGKISFIPQSPSLNVDEDTVRKLVPKGEVITMLGGMITGRTIQRFLGYKSYTVAIEIAKMLDKKKLEDSAFPTEMLMGPLACEVGNIAVKEKSGFSDKTVTLQSSVGLVELEIENEFMKVTLAGKTFAFPQLIMLIDSNKSIGLHSSEIQTGMNVSLIVCDAFSFWKGK